MIQPAQRPMTLPSQTSDAEDLVRIMLKDIGRIPMLTAEEEMRLAQQIRVAKRIYRRQMLRHRPVTIGCIALLEQVQAGEVRLDRALQVSLANSSAKARCQLILRLHLSTLCHLVENAACQNDRFDRRIAEKLVTLFDEAGLTTSRMVACVKSARIDCPRVEQSKQRYDSLRNRMVSANLRLAVSVARKYQSSGVPLLDLIQEGSEGLMRAAEKFEPERGFKFSTYAVWWIRQRISNAANTKARVIRVGDGALKRLRALAESAAMDEELDSRRLSFEQLCPRTVSANRAAELRRTFFAARDIVSLDIPTGRDESMTPASLVSETALDPYRPAMRNEQRSLIREALAALSEKEQKVIALRFGLNDEPAHTLAEAGRALSLSRERIRQLEREGLRKMRANLNDVDAESYLLN